MGLVSPRRRVSRRQTRPARSWAIHRPLELQVNAELMSDELHVRLLRFTSRRRNGPDLRNTGIVFHQKFQIREPSGELRNQCRTP